MRGRGGAQGPGPLLAAGDPEGLVRTPTLSGDAGTPGPSGLRHFGDAPGLGAPGHARLPPGAEGDGLAPSPGREVNG